MHRWDSILFVLMGRSQAPCDWNGTIRRGPLSRALKKEVNHKRIGRIYREEGLQARRRKRKRISRGDREPLVAATQANQVWAMDFVSDTAGRRAVRLLTVLDCYLRFRSSLPQRGKSLR